MCIIIVKKGGLELVATLTPKYYLKGNALEEREKFESIENTLKYSFLEFEHEQKNAYDKNAIAVYSNDIHIGYIQKRFIDRDVVFEVESFFLEAKNEIWLPIGCQSI